MDILTCIWLIFDIFCLAVVLATKFKNMLPGFLQDLMIYGKTRPDYRKMNLHWSRQILLVPNRWFIHFYALGFVWNVVLLTIFIQNIIDKHTSDSGMLGIAQSMITASSSEMDCFSILLTLVLLKIQLFRRLYESLFVSSFSGKMHLAHYITGVVFYFLVNITVLAEIPYTRSKGWYHSCVNPSYQEITWLHFLGTFLFFWASYHQYQCHIILGKLASWTADGAKIYKVPHGDWFEHVSSPHYLAEILIYFSLFIAMQGQCLRWILVLVFVVLNLTLTAHNTHTWYKKKFESYPSHRCVIVPYIY